MPRTKLILFMLFIALGMGGCGDDLIDDGVDEVYSVKGLLFHNPNSNSSFCYAFILQEGDPMTTLTAYLVKSSSDSVQLSPIGGGAYLTAAGVLQLEADSTYYLRAGEDFDEFYYSMALEIADTFRVQVVNPANHQYSGGVVNIEWNAPSQDFGYFVTIQPPSTEVAPFAEFANTTNSFSIPADAFAKPNGERVAGIYYIYVVAYSETFYSDAVIENSSRIFFPYPDTGFTDNIDLVDTEGRFGSAIISYRDSIEVLQNP